MDLPLLQLHGYILQHCIVAEAFGDVLNTYCNITHLYTLL